MTETQTKVVKTAGQIKGYYGLKTFEAASKNTLKGLAKDFLGKDEDARNLFLQLVDENFFAQTSAAGEDIEKALEAKFGASNSQNNVQAQQAQSPRNFQQPQYQQPSYQPQQQTVQFTQPVQNDLSAQQKRNLAADMKAGNGNENLDDFDARMRKASEEEFNMNKKIICYGVLPVCAAFCFCIGVWLAIMEYFPDMLTGFALALVFLIGITYAKKKPAGSKILRNTAGIIFVVAGLLCLFVENNIWNMSINIFLAVVCFVASLWINQMQNSSN